MNLLNFGLSIGALLLVTGCSPVDPVPSRGHIEKSISAKQFVLPETYTSVHIRGLANYRWVEGLTAGPYSEEAKNEEGTFFRGPGKCVIQLANKLGENFEKTGKIPTIEEINQGQGAIRNGQEGGIWIPNDPTKYNPRLYYFMNNSGARESGLLSIIIYHATDGSFGWGAAVEDPRILKAFNFQIMLPKEK